MRPFVVNNSRRVGNWSTDTGVSVCNNRLCDDPKCIKACAGALSLSGPDARVRGTAHASRRGDRAYIMIIHTYNNYTVSIVAGPAPVARVRASPSPRVRASRRKPNQSCVFPMRFLPICVQPRRAIPHLLHTHTHTHTHTPSYTQT